MQKRHAGANFAIAAHKAHALTNEFAVIAFANDWLTIERQNEILFRQHFRHSSRNLWNVHVKKRHVHLGQVVPFGWRVRIGDAVIEHLLARRSIGRINIRKIDLIHTILGNENRQLRQLMHVAFHRYKSNTQANRAFLVLTHAVKAPNVLQNLL